jgi:hypothetical protein
MKDSESMLGGSSSAGVSVAGGRFADRRDAEPSSGEGVCHGVQWSVPEGQDDPVPVHEVVLGYLVSAK